MGSSAVQKSLIANLVQSLCGQSGLGAALRRLRGLVHQSEGSEPFTSFPLGPAWEATSVSGFSPWLAGKPQNAWETRGRRDGCYPQDASRRHSSFPFHWREVYRKTTNTKAKTSSGPFPAIYFLTYCNGTNWCRQEKTMSKQSSLISMQGFGSIESLRWQNHLFLVFEPMLDWSKKLKGLWVADCLAHATFATLAQYMWVAL